jgi:hypothetical protein
LTFMQLVHTEEVVGLLHATIDSYWLPVRIRAAVRSLPVPLAGARRIRYAERARGELKRRPGMSQERLNLRWTVRRIWTAIGAVAVCGLLAGIAVVALHPPMLTSTALVLLPQAESGTQSSVSSGQSTISPYTATQIVIADS